MTPDTFVATMRKMVAQAKAKNDPTLALALSPTAVEMLLDRAEPDPTLAADLALAAAVRRDLDTPGWPHEYHKSIHETQCRACGWLAASTEARDDRP
jgi:hypothetical protein